MKNKILSIAFLLSCFLAFLLSGCNIKENYSMQSGFTNEMITETKVENTADGISMEIPFADFSCDAVSFKPVLDRDVDTFTIVLEGNETEQRCSQKFFADITGIKSGKYELKVIYKKGDQEQQVIYQEFTITK